MTGVEANSVVVTMYSRCQLGWMCLLNVGITVQLWAHCTNVNAVMCMQLTGITQDVVDGQPDFETTLNVIFNVLFVCVVVYPDWRIFSASLSYQYSERTQYSYWPVAWLAGSRRPQCIIVPNLLKSVKRFLRFHNFSIFQDGGRPPSWICLGRIWTPT